jgi:isopenicillin N synthase-like dioxygenase
MPAETIPDANAIPVIDLGPYLAGEPGALDHAAAELRHALTEIGFYTIVNHGVPSALVHEVYRQVARFHARPLGEKLKIKLDKHNVGYRNPLPKAVLCQRRRENVSAGRSKTASRMDAKRPHGEALLRDKMDEKVFCLTGECSRDVEPASPSVLPLPQLILRPAPAPLLNFKINAY